MTKFLSGSSGSQKGDRCFQTINQLVSSIRGRYLAYHLSITFVSKATTPARERNLHMIGIILDTNKSNTGDQIYNFKYIFLLIFSSEIKLKLLNI